MGIPGTGGTRVSVQMFFSMKDTKTPVYVAGVAMAVNLTLCWVLSRRLGLGGVALAGTISAFCNFFFLLAILRRRVGRIIDGGIVRSLLKSLVSSFVMAVCLFFLIAGFEESMSASRVRNAGFTLLFLLCGVLIFFALNIVLKNRDILSLKDALIDRIKKKGRP
jgi:putative peptidoglycan lipid II flippase